MRNLFNVFFVTIFLFITNPINALSPFITLDLALYDLTSYDSIGTDADFFEKALAQKRHFSFEGPYDEEELETAYSSIEEFIPDRTRPNPIQLNENGKVLYRVHTDVEEDEEDESILYLYDSRTEKVSEIVKEVKWLYGTPYRLNNKDQILYFKPLSSKQNKYTVNILSKGKDRVIFDSRIMNSLELQRGQYVWDYNDFLEAFVVDMGLGFLSSVEFNDLGQALFSTGDEVHQTFLIDFKYHHNPFYEWRLSCS